MEENLEFSLTKDLLEYTGKHVFLTGKAGTGKTTFLRDFYGNTSKNAIITAPTGVAAINAGGVTLHSMFNLPFQAYIPSLMSVDAQIALNQAEIRKHFRFNKNKLEVLQKLEVLIIDEISMVRADMLDAVNEALKSARRNPYPFGGVQILFIGDMFQLPPVTKPEEWNILSNFYDSPYFFDAKIFQELQPVSVELKHIYRQSDATFISLLSDIRNNDLNEFSAQLLNERYLPDFKNEEKIVTLTTHNRQANEINEENLKEIPEKSYGFYAEIDGVFPENAYPMPAEIELKKGAKVMFIKNDSSQDKKYYNGKIVDVVDLNEDEIWVQFPEDEKPYKLEREEWLNKQYKVEEDNEIKEETLGSFKHYPIRLAWAITIHKSQGLTFDEVVIDAERAFAPGQVYVALSRCTNLDGVYLTSRIQQRNLFLDEAIMKFQDNFWNTEAIEEVLKVEKNPYALERMFAKLDFQNLIRKVQKWIVYTHKNPNTYQEEISDVQIKIEKVLKQLQSQQKKFKQIALQQYQNAEIEEDTWQTILERSKKAVDYFLIELTTKVFQPLSKHIDAMEKKSRTVTYLKEVFPIENEVEAKIGELKKLKLMDEPLFENIKEELPKTSKKTNRKAKKKTSELTLELLNEGLTLEEVAIERNLSLGTIEGHIVDLVESGTLKNPEKWLNMERVKELKQLLPRDYKKKGLTELMQATGNKYSFFELKIVKVLNLT